MRPVTAAEESGRGHATPVSSPRLRTILAADLFANTGRKGLLGGLSAAFYDPSFSTVLWYRLASHLHAAGHRRSGKLLWRVNVMLSACHLHLEAIIAPGLKLPHPTGVTIGIGARLGPSVTVYQNVTIGSGYRDGSYPTISERCIIFPNAIIVGDIVIGAAAVIGAGALVTTSIASEAVVGGSESKVIRIGSGRRVGVPTGVVPAAQDTAEEP